MGRLRKITLSALNIKTEPHSPQKYIDLFKSIWEIHKITKIRGSNWGTIGELRHIYPNKPLKGFVGYFYSFLNIDPTEPWFDTLKREKVEITDSSKIPVPDNLKPNLKVSAFVFVPSKHRLVYDTANLAPTNALKLMEGLFAVDAIGRKFGEIEVIQETDKYLINSILRIPQLTRLEVMLTVPNPDDLSDSKRRILERLKNQKAKRIDEKLVAQGGAGLKPDETTVAMMQLASSNGSVKAVGYDRTGERIEKHTKRHPVKETYSYDPDSQSYEDMLLKRATELAADLAKDS